MSTLNELIEQWVLYAESRWQKEQKNVENTRF